MTHKDWLDNEYSEWIKALQEIISLYMMIAAIISKSLSFKKSPYKGEYYIYDLPEVCVFQRKYLAEVEKQIALKLPLLIAAKVYESLCISFYALGEFGDEKKGWYLKNVIPDCPHGYIAWNPHSGATDDLSLFKHDIKVTIGIEPGIKIIQW